MEARWQRLELLRGPLGGGKKSSTAGVPGWSGCAPVWGRAEATLLHPSPGTGIGEVQCVLRKWLDWITGKIKGAKLGLGLGEVSEKGTAKGQQLAKARRGCWELRVGAGIHTRQEALLTRVTGMWGHQARASSLSGSWGRGEAET